eukprot:358380-Chlamydomonas_euryale.AAC.3
MAGRRWRIRRVSSSCMAVLHALVRFVTLAERAGRCEEGQASDFILGFPLHAHPHFCAGGVSRCLELDNVAGRLRQKGRQSAS